jgi:outer membrane protein TolC
MVGVNYRQENVSPVNHFYAGQVAVVLPILDRGQHSVGTARANLKRDEANLKLTSMEVESDFTYAWENLKASKRGVELYPVSLIKESHNRFEKALDAFKKGQIDVMTFLQSDTQISENINQVYLSRLEYLESLSAIEQLIGHSMEQI